MLIADSNAPGEAGRPDRIDTNARSVPPGILLEPLGCMAPSVFALARRHPRLAVRMLGFDQVQVHLLAFALAYDPGGLGRGVLAAAAGAPVRAVLAAMDMGQLAGLGRALRHLPQEALPANAYRCLADLLADPVAADILNHAAEIDELLLCNLANLEAPWRTLPLVTALGDTPDGASVLLEWAALLAARRGDADDRYVAGQLTAARTFKDLCARIARLCAELPLPDGLPPAVVGEARRLETATDIRRVARRFDNCLRDRIDDVDGLTSLFYLWLADDDPVVCEVSRAKRLGWALWEHLGPRNAAPDASVARQIEADFRQAGIPPWRVAAFGSTMRDNLQTDDARALHDDDDDDDDSADDEMPRRRPRRRARRRP
jgi:hypothetical protein